MKSMWNAALSALLVTCTIASFANANPLPSRTAAKNELIKRCMQKSMSERRDLQYNDAAKQCATQVELQSNAAAATAVNKSPASS